MVGDIVELEYIFPEQEIDARNRKQVTGIKFNLKLFFQEESSS